MRVLVTGGAGFIGSHLVEELVKRKHKVRVLDNLSTGRMENLEAVEKKIEFIKGNISDKPTVDEAMKGCKQAYHLAAMVSVQDSIQNPVKTWDINIRGTLLVLGAAKKEKVTKRVVRFTATRSGCRRWRMARCSRNRPMEKASTSTR